MVLNPVRHGGKGAIITTTNECVVTDQGSRAGGVVGSETHQDIRLSSGKGRADSWKRNWGQTEGVGCVQENRLLWCLCKSRNRQQGNQSQNKHLSHCVSSFKSLVEWVY